MTNGWNQAWAAAIPGKVFEFLNLNSKQKVILSLLFWDNAHFNSRIVNCYQIIEFQQKMPELLTWKFNFWKHPTILESLPPRSGNTHHSVESTRSFCHYFDKKIPWNRNTMWKNFREINSRNFLVKTLIWRKNVFVFFDDFFTLWYMYIDTFLSTISDSCFHEIWSK